MSMTHLPSPGGTVPRPFTRALRTGAFGLTALAVAACASTSSTSSTSMEASSMPGPDMSAPLITAPSPDPRIGLKAGLEDAGEAIWNLRKISHTPAPEHFAGITNSDLAFSGTNVIQGNYNGFQIWDISNPSAPRLRDAMLCPASQSDVSVYKNLLFVSAEAPTARLDCGATAPTEAVSKERIRGVRIFDITDIDHPKYLANVQTCRGSHTHTVVNDPKDPNNVYIYISGTSGVRPAEELAGCVADGDNPNTALFRIEVIQVPLAHPEQAHIVASPRIFADASTGAAGGLASPKSHGISPADTNAVARARADSVAKARAANAGGRGGRGAPAAGAPANTGRGMLTQCHDITVYPAVGMAGGACAGMGLLLDIKDKAHPTRMAAVADSNFSFWHSATFTNDGKGVLFSDEWGGGGAAYCRAEDPKNWGADAIFSIVNGQMVFRSYYKMPAAQTSFENCVAHNGSLIPIPGRTVMVQAWYQGGISMFEWTDPSHPHEIGFFDRGPNDGTRLKGGGFWSAYWYNGQIVGSEMQRGLDVFELTPSAAISQNEIDAAKSVHVDFLNVQDQQQFVWPATFALARAYTDQLERWKGLSAEQVAAVRDALTTAESVSGGARAGLLTKLAGQVNGYRSGSNDAQRVQWLSTAVKDLAGSR
jgi:hypothetical protein